MEHPYGYIKEGKVYLKGFLNQEDRVIGEVKEDEASTIKYFEERFEMLLEKVNKLKQDIEENQNKGSFLMKLIHLRDSLYAYDALGDFVPVIEELNGIQTYLEEIIQQNRERNKTIKEGLIMEALDLKDSDEWKEAGEAMKELKMRWIKTGPVDKELEEEMERTFNAILDYFFDRRKQFFDELAKQAEVNIKTYESLVMQAQQAFNMPDAKKAFEISKRIQKEWKEAGRVPAERRAPLWDEFSKLNNRIFSRYRRSLQTGPQLRPWEITKKMEEMLAEVKRIAKSPSTYEGTNTVKKIQGEWKKLPPRKPREAKLLMSSFQFFAEVAFEKAS
ncbi:hypothetical protein A3SI_13672 [Nitritalea halalkaliphila LW7]|uniref:DUF349 domain-containing protein n=1 Tax=Nitritalea halalkaliphila LW7 TaxID=1189621 RepID=I5C0U1_9BACT|nr:DUF349 domain-containing protein [Nitritalea halalkaliphila]EIM75443.1 hypothetical protein A3SI_13672 [Nitritalea halalkaliphila LW7]